MSIFLPGSNCYCSFLPDFSVISLPAFYFCDFIFLPLTSLCPCCVYWGSFPLLSSSLMCRWRPLFVMYLSHWVRGWGGGGNSFWGRRCAQASRPLEGVWFRHRCGPGGPSSITPGHWSLHWLWRHVPWVHSAVLTTRDGAYWTFSLDCNTGSSACPGGFHSKQNRYLGS